jgi:hypothetical protein
MITAYGNTFLAAASLMDPNRNEFPLTSGGSDGTSERAYSTFLESGERSCRNRLIFLLEPSFSRIDISGRIQ